MLAGTFAGAVSIFGPDALPVVHQWLLPGLEPATSRVRVAAHNHSATAAHYAIHMSNLETPCRICFHEYYNSPHYLFVALFMLYFQSLLLYLVWKYYMLTRI